MRPLSVASCAILILIALRPDLPITLLILAASGACCCFQIPANAAFVTAAPPEQRSQAFGLAAGMSLGQAAAMTLAGAAALHVAPALVIGAAGALGTVAAIGLAFPLAAGRSPSRAPDHV